MSEVEEEGKPGFARNLFALLRPHQWAKNGFVLAPVLFARAAGDPTLLQRAFGAAGLFCLAASAIYAFNDVVDAPRDRLHPKKRLRPVASGALAPFAALGLGLLLASAAIAGGFAIDPGLGRILAIYVVLNIFYTIVLKNLVIVDALVIAVSFVLRVLAGSAAVGVPSSHWILLCTLLLALFLAFSKRRAELALLAGGSENHRPALLGYSRELLDRFDGVLVGATIVAYALYTVSPETIAKFGSDRLVYGLPFVIYGLFRYLMLVERGADAGDPGRLALRDPALVACMALWTAFNAIVIYFR